jgi:hypothetical protein
VQNEVYGGCDWLCGRRVLEGYLFWRKMKNKSVNAGWVLDGVVVLIGALDFDFCRVGSVNGQFESSAVEVASFDSYDGVFGGLKKRGGR